MGNPILGTVALLGTGSVAPSSAFGPTSGTDWVRNNAGCRTVNDPGGGIDFTSIADLITKITANSADSTFVASGTTFAMSGDANEVPAGKFPNIYFPGLAYAGTKVIDAGGSMARLTCLDGMKVYGGKWIGTLCAGDINGANKYVSSIIGRGTVTVEDAWFLGNNKGFGYTATPTWPPGVLRVRYNDFQDGVRYGLGGAGTYPYPDITNALIEHNRVRGNRTSSLINAGGDCGAWKWLGTDGMICRYNQVDSNHGFAMWWDGGNPNLQCYDNVSENNWQAGLFYEISAGGTSMHNNHLANNGEIDPVSGLPSTNYSPFNDANILVSCSNGEPTEIDVSYNWIDGLAPAIRLIDHSGHVPAESPGTGLVHVHHNLEYLRGSGSIITGASDLHNQNLITNAGNTFESNEYHVAGYTAALTKWDWDGLKTWVQWQALGHDDTGSVVPI